MYCNYVLYARNNCLKASHNPTIFVAVMDFAVLVCRRYGHAFCRRLGMSPFWLWTLDVAKTALNKKTQKSEDVGKQKWVL